MEDLKIATQLESVLRWTAERSHPRCMWLLQRRCNEKQLHSKIRQFLASNDLNQCFFKVFERVSRWSLRVSTPFSLLCLILLTDFHKNASFPPNMLIYLNTTFTFGKQIKHNFINRKVECRPTYSFTHFRARFTYGESRGGSSPRMTGNNPRSTALSDSSACSTPRRDQQGRRCTAVRHLVLGRTLGRFPVGVDCSPKELIRHSFLEHSGYMAELT